MSFASADMKRLDYADIVIDYDTGLVWQDDSSSVERVNDIVEARARCAKLTLGGSQDYRIPTLNELKSIIDKNKEKPAIKSTFKNCVSANYLVQNKVSNSTSFWVIDFSYGILGVTNTNLPVYLRCVK